jgi:hypothetical protein
MKFWCLMDDELFTFVTIGSESVATSMIERIEEQQFCELRAETRGKARRQVRAGKGRN